MREPHQDAASDPNKGLTHRAAGAASRGGKPRARTVATSSIDTPPDVPVREISLERLVVVRNGALTTAGMPCAHTFSCGNAATMDELYEQHADAELGAYEQVASALAHSPRRREEREIRPINIDALPVRDYRDARLDEDAVEFARLMLGNGIGQEPWWQVAKTGGCGGILLPRANNLILFVFKSYSSYVTLGEATRTLDPEDVLKHGRDAQ